MLVEIEYQLSGIWDRPGLPPELPEGAVVLQTLWEVQIPWSQALIGVPRAGPTRTIGTGIFMSGSEGRGDRSRGWWRGLPASPAQTSSLDELLGEEQDSSHGYLFGRAGKPVAFDLWVAYRAGSSPSARAACSCWVSC